MNMPTPIPTAISALIASVITGGVVDGVVVTAVEETIGETIVFTMLRDGSEEISVVLRELLLSIGCTMIVGPGEVVDSITVGEG